ncbi:hypothetical protein H3H54_11570 [Brachybacterium sp. Z12]|uniref:hypothetical protein n=1 Tax=Brachybacterium sp. Z12 TaxID=2759167 RepID=UPI001862E29C|nr:hypothetical protein [Brachybacterium sp. Z12]QNN81921.1 hypothetical protein H3H54_11570 [Brachybacterium sp. Z12]
MSAAQTPDDLDRLLALASAHGLDLEGPSLRTEEMGLDFRVAIARAHDGLHWVMRIPRRTDVLSRADVEGKVLDLVAPSWTWRCPTGGSAAPS